MCRVPPPDIARRRPADEVSDSYSASIISLQINTEAIPKAKKHDSWQIALGGAKVC